MHKVNEDHSFVTHRAVLEILGKVRKFLVFFSEHYNKRRHWCE